MKKSKQINAPKTYKRRWISTYSESEWNGTEYVKIVDKGYWYEGPMALATNPPVIDCNTWAFYSDGTESGSTIIGSIATNPTKGSIAYDTTVFFRADLEETSGNKALNLTPRLQYRINTGGGYGAWTNVTSTSNVVRTTASANITDAGDTTRRLGTAYSFVTPNEGIDEADGLAGGNTTDLQSSGTEFLYSIQVRSADVSEDDTIELRLDLDEWSSGFTLNNTPTWPVITGAVGATTHNVSGSITTTSSISGASDRVLVANGRGLLRIYMPGDQQHTFFTPSITSPHILQDMTDADYDVQVECLTLCDRDLVGWGFALREGTGSPPGKYLRIGVQWQTTTTCRLYAAYVDDNLDNTEVLYSNNNIPSGTRFLKVVRTLTGDIYTIHWSSDGSSWNNSGARSLSTYTITPTRIGLFTLQSGEIPEREFLFDNFKVNSGAGSTGIDDDNFNTGSLASFWTSYDPLTDCTIEVLNPGPIGTSTIAGTAEKVTGPTIRNASGAILTTSAINGDVDAYTEVTASGNIPTTSAINGDVDAYTEVTASGNIPTTSAINGDVDAYTEVTASGNIPTTSSIAGTADRIQTHTASGSITTTSSITSTGTRIITANGGMLLDPEFLQPSRWNLTTGWTISGGTISYDGTGASQLLPTTAPPLVQGKLYEVEVKVDAVTGTLWGPIIAGIWAGLPWVDTPGTYKWIASAGDTPANTLFNGANNTWTITLDYFRITELPESTIAGTADRIQTHTASGSITATSSITGSASVGNIVDVSGAIPTTSSISGDVDAYTIVTASGNVPTTASISGDVDAYTIITASGNIPTTSSISGTADRIVIATCTSDVELLSDPNCNVTTAENDTSASWTTSVGVTVNSAVSSSIHATITTGGRYIDSYPDPAGLQVGKTYEITLHNVSRTGIAQIGQLWIGNNLVPAFNSHHTGTKTAVWKLTDLSGYDGIYISFTGISGGTLTIPDLTVKEVIGVSTSATISGTVDAYTIVTASGNIPTTSSIVGIADRIQTHTVSGSITTTSSITGTAEKVGAKTATGSITTTSSIAGTADRIQTHTVSGSITTTSSITGTAEKVAVVTGSITTISSITGAADRIQTHTASGSITTTSSIAGTAEKVGAKTATGSITTISSIAGTADRIQTHTVSGSITTTSSIAGTADRIQTHTASGLITTTSSITGTAEKDNVKSATGSITTISSIAGTADRIQTHTASGSITTTSSIAGIANRLFDGSGTITTSSSINGIAERVLEASGSIVASSSLSGAGKHGTIGVGNLIRGSEMLHASNWNDIGASGFTFSNGVVTYDGTGLGVLFSAYVDQIPTNTWLEFDIKINSVTGGIVLYVAGSPSTVITSPGIHRGRIFSGGNPSQTGYIHATQSDQSQVDYLRISNPITANISGSATKSLGVEGSITTASSIAGSVSRVFDAAGAITTISAISGIVQSGTIIVASGAIPTISTIAGSATRIIESAGSIITSSTIAGRVPSTIEVSGSTTVYSTITGVALRVITGEGNINSGPSIINGIQDLAVVPSQRSSELIYDNRKAKILDVKFTRLIGANRKLEIR